MKSTGTRLTIVVLIVLVVLLLVSKPSPEWIQAQLDSLDKTKDAPAQVQDRDVSVIPDVPAEKVEKHEQKVTNVMYQWKDEKGNLQFTEKPPVDREYKEIIIQTKKGKAAPKPTTLLRNNQVASTKTKNIPEKVESSSALASLSSRCKSRYSMVERFEEKLEKANSIRESIWLQDYCSALGDFIQEGCVLPKAEVKFNSYCPLRFKR